MIEICRKIWVTVIREEKMGFFLLLVVSIGSSILQVLSIASFVPFIGALSAPEKITTSDIYLKLDLFFNFTDANDFLAVAGMLVLVILVASNVALTFTTWAISRYANKMGMRLTYDLFHSYIYRPYEFHLNQSGSELTKNILMEGGRTINGVLNPLLDGAARLVTALLMVIFLVVADPMVALGAMLFLGVIYVGLSKLVRDKLTRSGEILSRMNRQRFKLVLEGLGGIKHIILTSKESYFLKRFTQSSNKIIKVAVFSATINQVPKFVVETMLFGAMLLFIVVSAQSGSSIDELLPMLGLYALTGYRLVPALQEVFSKVATIRYASPALDIVYDALTDHTGGMRPKLKPSVSRMSFDSMIELRDLKFRYFSADKNALNGINLKIPSRTAVGLVGHSGSGKSTLVDIILGVLRAEDGQLIVDGEPIKNSNVRDWQNLIGYVPQRIFISDASIKENIAFGLEKSDIDMDDVVEAAKMANLHDFITTELPAGYDTVVGDNGSRLSGGQCQRIGIARALYGKPQLLVLDEATSALDSVTEKQIIDSIFKLGKDITVIMVAHRFSTIKNCDQIVLMESGKVKDIGKYDELVISSETFKEMAALSSK